MPKNQRNFDPMSEEFDFSAPAAPAPAAPPAPAPPAPQRGSISSRARAAVPAAAADYLEGLNPEQRAAVEMLDGPLLVLAGAGTGKTRVLTTRIAHILATGRARGGQVLAVTFTNKAAREMKQRIGALIGGDVEGMPWLGTFHSIGVKILRRHAELAGLKSGFTILDTDDQIRLLKQVIDAAGIDKDRWPARQLAGLIDGWKNRGQTPDMVPKGEAFAFANGKGGQLYADYQARLKELNAVDFGDLLVECVRLFREHPDVLAEYRSRFRYMLVDEYQDTNTVQYIWLKLLALGRENSHWGHTPSSAASNGSPATAREDLCPQPNQPNICCVGDEDQCLSAGTMVRLGRGGEKRIEAIKAGDSVLSCFGSGDLRPAKVLRVHRRARTGRLVRIVLASGRTLTSTPEHVHFAGYRQGVSPQTNFVYLMQKRGFGFRLGTTQVHTKGQKQPVLGFMQRSLQEHADALWIVSAHASEPEARFEEMRLSLAYGIPTLPFVARKGGSRNGLVHDQAAIARLFDMLDTEAGGSRLLSDHALSIDEPHHHPQSRNASRRNVTVTLCGDRRGSNPMHRLSIVGNDEEGAQALSRLGFSVRPAKAGSSSWRVETAKSSWSEIAADIERMRDAFPLTVIRQARFGRDNAERDKSRASNSLPFRRAASIRPGMVMFTDDGYDVVRSIEQIEERTDVIDLDVEKTHNFVANGIITHNSIYGWRGAEVDNILRFEKDFPGGQVIRLERNYRSTGHILATAAHVIARNQSRLGKTLFTDGQKGDKVTVTGVWDDTEEARIVSDEIERVRKAGHKLNQIAILVRASFQMRAFEDRFITLGLPYRVIGGPRFYERAEIKDAIAYLEVVHNPAHDLKFERIVNVPKRGIGDTTVSRIIAHSRARQIPLATAAAEMIQADELAPKTRRALGDLLRSIERWRGQIGSMRHNELAELIFDESGYTGMLQADKSPQAQSRLENLKELVRLMHDFDTLEGFLEHVALVMDADAGSDGERVSLMTLHAAKGLEFDTVFLPGWEEGLFPHQRSLDESGLKGLEEERRLAYVGITRARKRAAISFTENRRMRGLFQSAIPSRFVDELPETDVEVIEAKGPFSGAYRGLGGGGMAGSRFDGASFQASSYQTPGWQRAQNQNQSKGQSSYPGKSGGTAFGSGKTQRWADKGGGRFPKMIEGQVIASSTGAASSYKIGDRVFHEKFGYGAVSAVDGNKLTVEFDKAGQKKVVDSFIDRAS